VLHELPHAVWHVDRSIVRTIGALLTRPGRTIREYLDGKRARYFNPLLMMVFFAGFSVLLGTTLPINTSFFAQSFEGATGEEIQRYYTLSPRHYSASLILFLPLAALSSWQVFRRWGRTFGEHVAIDAYLIAVTTFLFALVLPILAIPSLAQTAPSIWVGASAVILTYQVIALAAVFQRPGRRFLAALWAVLAVALFLAFVNFLTYAGFFLVYQRIV
jgi:hypothetical protein